MIAIAVLLESLGTCETASVVGEGDGDGDGDIVKTAPI